MTEDRDNEIEMISENQSESESSSEDDGIFEKEKVVKYEKNTKWSFSKFLEVLFFRPTFPQLLKARRGNLKVGDLHRMPRPLYYETYEEKLKRSWEHELKSKRPWLIWSLIKQEWWYMLIAYIAFALYEIFSLGFPISSKYIVKWLKEDNPEKYWGYLFLVFIIICQIVICFSQEFAKKWSFVSALRMRNGLTGLIYEKALRLNAAGIEEPGRFVNLMANDAAVGLENLEYFLMGISCPPMFVILYSFVFYYMGHWMWVPFGTLIIFLIINFVFAIVTNMLYEKFVYKKDKRVSYISEVLHNIKFIKYNAWEDPTNKRIFMLRLIEELFLYACEFVRCFFYTFTNQFGSVLAFVLFLVMYCYKAEMDMSSIVTTISLFKSIRVPVRRIGMAATSYSAMNVSMERIKKFLLKTELQPVPVQTKKSSKAIVMKDVEYKFPNGTSAFSCKKLKIKKGELVCVLGGVGSGKSSFVLSLLSELERTSGETMINGKFTYASQSSWLMNATVRENICFLEPYNKEKYTKVVKAACLTADIDSLVGGDQYVIAEKGANLSGGQRQRIALARTLYNARDIMLLDDPLSAVDFKVGTYIFENAIQKYLDGKTRIIVTNQTYFLEKADKILVLDNNELAFQGSLEELKNSDLEAANLIKTLSQKKEDNNDTPAEIVSGDSYSTRTREEAKEVGRVPTSVYLAYLKASLYIFALLLVLLIAARVCAQYYYNRYLTKWDKSISDEYPQGEEKYFVLFCVTFGADFIGLLLCEFAVITFCIVASHNLHSMLIKKLLKAKLGFFDVTPKGRVLNYFSKDFQQIDYVIPANIERLIVNICSVAIIAITVVQTSIYLVILVLVIATIFLVIYAFASKPIIEMQRLEGVLRSPVFIHFDQTLLGLSTIRSENGQHSFKSKLIDKIKNNTQSLYTTYMTKLWFLQRMDFIGTFVIVLTNAVIVICKTTDDTDGSSAPTIDPGVAGTALTNLTNVTTNINVIGLSLIEIETAMQSTERALMINKLRNEESEKVMKRYSNPSNEWPLKGEIRFEKFKFRYRKGLPLVLKGIDTKIQDKEKIGVVGRTGSGKSSLMAGLFRIEEPAGGRIFIDGIDITTIPLKTLRSRMCILPQEATMFSGTVRSNLDPFGNTTDEEMKRVLQLVNSPCDLDQEVTENGDNFSLGQKQMICMARALLKESKILIMDEATANIDIQTDQTIQEMVKEHFANVTVITVAHRLQTIMDSDRVFVLDHGNMMENDTPSTLVDQTDSIFHSLVEQSGCADELRRIAKNKEEMDKNAPVSSSTSSTSSSEKTNNKQEIENKDDKEDEIKEEKKDEVVKTESTPIEKGSQIVDEERKKSSSSNQTDQSDTSSSN